jgi:hypothetical protein
MVAPLEEPWLPAPPVKPRPAEPRPRPSAPPDEEAPGDDDSLHRLSPGLMVALTLGSTLFWLALLISSLAGR